MRIIREFSLYVVIEQEEEEEEEHSNCNSQFNCFQKSFQEISQYLVSACLSIYLSMMYSNKKMFFYENSHHFFFELL